MLHKWCLARSKNQWQGTLGWEVLPPHLPKCDMPFLSTLPAHTELARNKSVGQNIVGVGQIMGKTQAEAASNNGLSIQLWIPLPCATTQITGSRSLNGLTHSHYSPACSRSYKYLQRKKIFIYFTPKQRAITLETLKFWIKKLGWANLDSTEKG